MTIPAGLLEGIKNLDPLPVTAQRLTSALSDDRVSIGQLADIVEFDQAVASNVLRMANSALYGGMFPVEDLRAAVARLGTSALLNIALSNFLKRMRTSVPLYDLDENDLWRHGAVSSLAVSQIALVAPGGAPRNAAIAALVHDIGKLIVVRYLHADVKMLQNLCEKKQISFVQAEREVLGCDHAEVGAAMGRRWNFPEDIVLAIERHHGLPSAAPTRTLDVVVIANLIAKTLGVGLGAEGMNFEVDPGASQRLGLSFTAFCRACARTADAMADFEETLAAA